ncbi:aminoglycoside phosphotransferase (APT) family kinase protein [Streptosporangium becharense]|uniref:Aminoglycoside phosphotransferase (APT) family kinase protein n=1 Tax=Streptosporangium becharense TaxID=1816182 RepID=A0A7W9MI35_9ACTN|nr:phosphotransferase family protein [Streptosporangium becharense]MBB2911155.1 aminoglycoside phosphotransferase (APT) family kinase protein [Streptosporangium becharense]MBB5821787.1 aminoglycoside phosphotransferase (APT) family kinase protein [Streptosporangium becharense]
MSIPGIDRVRLTAWMAANVPDAGEPTGVSLIAGGRSNLTYVVETPERRLVLRRPPLGHVLPTAHDMGREWRVISALAPTPVPVPEPVAFCGDPDVIGAPFYLMAHVDGVAVRSRQDAARLSPEQARRLSERLAEVLAAIHAVDYEAAGLGGFGRPEGYLARQLERWGQQWERSKTAELPEYDRLAARLRERLPARSAATLVHGDYRLDNTLVEISAAPDILAVVDWEMSTLGDPLADLGLTLTYWQDPGDLERASIPVAAGVTVTPGFLTAREFAAHYAEISGADLSDLDFYLAFGNFKLAVIIEGIHARFKQGKTVGEGFEDIGAAVPTLVERAHRVLDG